MEPVIFFLTYSMNVQRGGLTLATLNQANTLADMGYKTYILTVNFDPGYQKIRHDLLASQKLSPKVQMLNMYEALQGQEYNKADAHFKTFDRSTQEGIWEYVEDKKAYRVYNNGLYGKYIQLKENDSLDFIDYFNENYHRIKREVYDPYGRVRSIQFMDFHLNKARQIVYYNEEGRAYLTNLRKPEKNGEEQTVRLATFYHNGFGKNYKSLLKLQRDWVDSLLEAYDHPVVESDARPTHAILPELKTKKAAKLCRMHSNHILRHSEKEIKEELKPIFDNMDKLDAISLLTNEQKNDIVQQYGHENIIHHVPHSVTAIDTVGPKHDNPNLAVIIARLGKGKQIDHAIRAFKQVTRQNPKAILQIWGIGGEERNLKKVIKQQGLQDHVFLKGYTNHPEKIYNKAACTIVTSIQEGFSLAILESQSQGTPVVSYDIKYGPRDLIKDQANGFIVSNHDEDALANKIGTLLGHPKLAQQMGKKAIETARSYNKEDYKKNWEKLIQDALINRDRRMTQKG